MKPFIKRAVGVLAATLAVATSAGVANADTATLSPLNGTAAITAGGLRDAALDTPFNLTLTAGAHCSGNAASGYAVRSYFIGSGVTLSSVDFTALGLNLPATGVGSGTTFVSTLPNAAGGAFTVNPGNSAPFPVSGLPQLSMYRMVNKATIPAGVYHMGFACVDSTNHVDGANFWDTFVTVSAQTATQFSWQFGAAPTGAALSGTAGDASATLNYTIPASTPAVTSATITGGPSTITLAGAQLTAGAHTGLAVPGLTNGTTYNFTLTASNGISPDATANASVTPSLAVLNNITGLTASATGATTATVSWTAPAANAGGQTPTGYTLSINGGAAVAATSPTSLTGLTASTSYTIVVTAVYSQANTVAAPQPASVTFTTTSSTIIYQDISVNRPNGLLVMTQRCSAPGLILDANGAPTLPLIGSTINGSIPGEPAQVGFPNGIAATASTSVATAPGGAGGPGDNGYSPVASDTPFDAASAADPSFDPATLGLLSGYPYPQNADGTVHRPAYGTRCTINLGNAKLLTTSNKAGQYFVAAGQLDQVTIVNTHDTDTGWTVTGKVTNFTKTNEVTTPSIAAKTAFSGDYLGWTPARTGYITPAQADGLGSNYTMAVTPGTGTTQGVGGGLSDGDVLATSPNGQSLGIVQLDARLKLLIPTSVKAGTYHATLSLSAIEN